MNQAAHIMLAAVGVPSGALTATQVGLGAGILFAIVGALPLILRELRLTLLGVLEHNERVAARASGDEAAHRDGLAQISRTRFTRPGSGRGCVVRTVGV